MNLYKVQCYSPFELIDCIDLLELLLKSFDFGLLFVLLLDLTELSESGTSA
jgi:hypothetical protein